MPLDLTNRVIAITGASAGIGAATAVACAAAGMDVVLAARRVDRLEAVARQVEAAGRAALVVACDVQRDADVAGMYEQAQARFGRLDAVFANAGYGVFASIADTSDDRIRDIFETNFFGTIRCIKMALPYLRQTARANGHKGHILICSSACSEIGVPMYGYYAATKAAQDAIAGAMRAEVAHAGIYVSSVHPIGTKTEFFEVVKKVSPECNGQVGLNTPASLMHSAETVARAVVNCLRRPRPEVWPAAAGLGARLGLAFTTAMPRISAWAMRDMIRKRFRKNDGV